MINFKVILNVLGFLLLALSALMLFPLIADAIKNNSVPEVSLSDGLIAVVVGEAAEKSIKLGRLINIEEIIN